MSRINWNRLAVVGIIVGLAVLGAVFATKETWGPDVLGDPTYRSSRASLCNPPDLAGEELPRHTDDFGLQPLKRGFGHSWVYTFDAARLAGGDIQVCSEYGSIKLIGVESKEVRLRLTVANYFPGGADAVKDTNVTTQVRNQGGQLQVGLWQLTQGITAFRSLFAKGARPAMVDVVLELPRSGIYNLHLTANHQRITVQGLDVRGVIEGYLSPGADIDAGLAGELTLRLNGGSFRAKWPGDTPVDLHGGTTARLRPLRSGSVDVKANKGDVLLTIVGSAVGLDVKARGANGRARIDIGPSEASLDGPDGTCVRSAGYVLTPIQVEVRAISPDGVVTIGRAMR